MPSLENGEDSSDDMEKPFCTCRSMEAIRKRQPVLKEAWAQSMGPVVKFVEQSLDCLIYSGQEVHRCDLATDEDIKLLLILILTVF